MQVGDMKGQYRYIMATEIYNKLTEDKVIEEASARSGLPKGTIKAGWDAAGEVIKSWATEGHSVALPGLGTMRFGVRAKSVASVNDVAAGLITTRRVIFTPNANIKKELHDTSISITCYDRSGNLVKKVTSDDSGTVEDDDNTSGSQTSGDTGSDGDDMGGNID